MKASSHFSLFLALLSILSQYAYCSTSGQPWPLPQSYSVTPNWMPVTKNFNFEIVDKSCDILEAAVTRYAVMLFGNPSENTVRFSASSELSSLQVDLSNDCEAYPSLYMDESYDLNVSGGSSKLSAKSIWGILRGLETFSQLIYEAADGSLVVNETTIHDFPRFSHRGVLLDTSRHFISKEVLLQNLDAMAYNKFNVFHWHIVDDQSFPYESKVFPKLSQMGAYDPYSHVYTQEDIKEIIEYARLRGIRVVPEFDSPGHSESWGKGYPQLLTPCYGSDKKPDGSFGPVNPILDSTYVWLKTLFGELSSVFPDKYFHVGGDEVSFACWQSNPDIQNFIAKRNWTYAQLEQYYINNVLHIVAGFNESYIIWQEVVDNGAKVQPDTVVEVWKGGYQAEMARVTKMGYTTILASCWYLNYISYGTDWPTYYNCDPQDFNGTDAQKQLVIGGEMTMWGEYVDSTNVISRTWPRGGAVGERLWSNREATKNSGDATGRLEEQRCRMLQRGLRVEPINGPGYCRHEWQGP